MPEKLRHYPGWVRRLAEPRQKADAMLKLPGKTYLHNYVDRHGRERCYYRPPGRPAVTLNARPIGGPEWFKEYAAARNGEPIPSIGASRSKAGTFDAVIASYFASNEYRVLNEESRRVYAGAFNFLREKLGKAEVAIIRRRQIKELLAQTESTWGHNSLLIVIRKVIAHAIDLELRDDDPTIRIKKIASKNPFGHRCWTAAYIEQYRKRHPIGSVARLALEIAFNTGLRISDVAVFGRKHLRDGGKSFTIVPKKTARFGTIVSQPIRDPLLIAAMAAAPVRGQRPFLCTPTAGVDYSENWLGAHFAQWCKEAGLPDFCRCHGLRKAFAVQRSHAGCAKQEIMADLGDRDPKMVELYTRERDTWLLSVSAADKVDAMTARS